MAGSKVTCLLGVISLPGTGDAHIPRIPNSLSHPYKFWRQNSNKSLAPKFGAFQADDRLVALQGSCEGSLNWLGAGRATSDTCQLL